MTHLPHRITFLASQLTLPKADRTIEAPLAHLIHAAVFRAFATDTRVAMKDPDAFAIAEAKDLWTINHPDVEQIIAAEFVHGGRHAVMWLELDLAADVPAKLHVRSPDGDTRVFEGPGGSVSDSINGAFASWRTAHDLGPMRTPLESASKDAWLAAARRGPPADPVDHNAELARDPGDPVALLLRYLEEERPATPKDFSPLARIVALARNFAPAYRQWRGEGADGDDALDALAMCVMLDPADDEALELYGRALSEAGALEAGHRLALRALAVAPNVFSHITGALETATELVRPGYQLALAERLRAEASEGPFADWFNTGNPDVTFVNLARSSAHFYAGRLEEAIALRGEVLEGMAGSWPNQTRILTEWKTLSERLTNCYAREGRARGDLGRVLEGHSLALPTTAGEIANVVHTLCELGEPKLALLAYAHARTESPRRHPVARLAGALAAMSCGELPLALAELSTVELRAGRQGLEVEANRVLRVGASITVVAWEDQVKSLSSRGAKRIAWLAARSAADFVPGAEKSKVIMSALGARGRRSFSPAWLDLLASELFGKKAAATRKRLDAALEPAAKGGLAAADRLVTAFWDVLGKVEAARGKELLYIAVSCTCRYLALTTDAPSVLAGGYRQAAALALEASSSSEFAAAELTAVLVALEKASAGVDPWTFDTWLLMVERALRIEEQACGRTEPLTRGLPTVLAHLRGDLTIGYELAYADRIAAKEPGAALALYERCLRAGCASNVGYRLAHAAEQFATDEMVVDLAFVGLQAVPAAAALAVTIAKHAFAHGAATTAFDVLVAHLGRGGKTWREAQVAGLTAAWKASKLDVPIDFDEAQAAGLVALQAGEFEKARRCYAWCDALDPNNAVTLKNLGMTYARLGDVTGALAAFALADRKAAPTWTAHELMASRKFPESMPAHRYASLFYDNATLFIYAAKSAWFAGDDESKLFAIRRARALDPAAVDLTYLNGLADAAGSFGMDEECEAAARELIVKGKDDPTFLSLGHHHLALALLRRGAAKEALTHAKEAAKLNPQKDNAADFDALVGACKKGKAPAPKPMRTATPAALSFARLREGDAKAALALVKRADKGDAAVARLAAARHRDVGEEAVAVTPRALDAASEVLVATAGTTTATDGLLRAIALSIVADARSPHSPPALLGKRLSRDAFLEEYVQRGGVMRRPIDFLP